jgi:leucyl-tRNA---protein transferase
MILLAEPVVSTPDQCPYRPGLQSQFQVFLADKVSGSELENLFSSGWRRFGKQFFRPVCDGCRACIPVRVKARELSMTKSQRRIVGRNAHVRVEFRELEYRDEIFEVYADHALHKFHRNAGVDELVASCYDASCDAMQSEYFVDDRLAAVGFIDRSSLSLSSVYFVYRKEFSRFGLGISSVFTESAYASSLGLNYYYLGYWMPDNASLEYKGRFKPQERYDWEMGEWKAEERQ